MAKAMMTTPEALERWFKNTEQPQWTLYANHLDQVSKDRSAKLMEQRLTEISMDESFARLIEMINLNSELGGDFTIWSPPRNNGTQGIKSHYRVSSATEAAKGVGGFPAVGMGYVSKSEIGEIIAKEREMWELRRDLEDMKAAQESNVGVGAMLVNTLLADGTIGAVIQSLVAQLAARFAPVQPPRAQVSGLAANAVPATAGTGELQAYDYTDGVYTALDRMRRYFSTDAEFEQAITTLATQFEAQPDVFKNMLK